MVKNLAQARHSFEQLGALYPLHKEVTKSYATHSGVSCCWFYPKQINGSEVIIYLHGGGFIYGSLTSHAALVSHLTHTIGRKVILIDYRLAPEHPFPNALEDIIDVIENLLQANSLQRLGIIGDSAGGNLAFATALRLKQLQLPIPIYQIVISPFVNLACTYPSYQTNQLADPILTKEFCQYVVQQYAREHSLQNPLLSPLLGELQGLNPSLILCGSLEILADDSAHLHKALLRAGVKTEYKVFEKATHVWPLQDINSQNSRQALQYMKYFISQHSSPF